MFQSLLNLSRTKFTLTWVPDLLPTMTEKVQTLRSHTYNVQETEKATH